MFKLKELKPTLNNQSEFIRAKLLFTFLDSYLTVYLKGLHALFEILSIGKDFFLYFVNIRYGTT